MEEPQGIYRGEVYAIMGALADIDVNVNVNVRLIHEFLQGGDDEAEEDDA